ncbi:probable ATP-dependent RNA helicase DDX10 [Wyeomyia smithii]|uniref:probable ATP-dependent RNA helicase DDX10 n=1 Tax=Wyeomyia smithii TaxID=174621 RepID=UPI00246803A7|nr:probable ATP-dependent RNA helicase DDX10 [Wyeomyia smithii]XP_055542453.1 probable ATP-dependent RNA helicase DDX10 [Wyeomyia smithii]XP_055542455.1 probable ATP-dependent RNA helicase DDX10 [Wyeomyia smithii]
MSGPEVKKHRAKFKKGRINRNSKVTKTKINHLKLSVDCESNEISRLIEKCINASVEENCKFSDFPLSKKTLQGLTQSQYKIPTAIQRESILPALQGKDILATAKTGSGKTLAFLIPIFEKLYVNQWTRLDGLGALIITPTRELALQIFETVAKIGKHHDFTTGLIIGGQNLKFEKSRLHQLNIIICTPGRVLQHMDQNPLFDSTNLKILVLDEADRCLDMGFEVTMNSIIENLPVERQTLLFSATQTKSVKDLARLNLQNPVYIAPHEKEQYTTPHRLQQNYVVIEQKNKLTMLWSFLRAHAKQKVIIFFATCKQVKFFYEIFRKLRPSALLLPLYGGMNQEKRNKIYTEFCARSNVCLMATDIASRGLDFPKVNWVVQLDCPEDAIQYIHRAGRAARLNTSGESLLVLIPQEENGMIEQLQKSKVPISKIHIDEKQLFSPLVKIQSFLAQSPELKESAKRAFVAYVKSVALMKDKSVFKVSNLDMEAYARSLGLLVTPRVRFLSKIGAAPKNVHTDLKVTVAEDDVDSSGDELFTVKCSGIPVVEEKTTSPLIKGTKKKITKVKLMKKASVTNKKIVFDDSGHETELKHDEVYDIEKARVELMLGDAEDKERYKALKKAKRVAQKEKLKRKSEEHDEVESVDHFDSGNEQSVDLNWLPDPDKIYVNHSSSGSVVDHKVPKVAVKVTKKRRTVNVSDITLNEAERLAMDLLQ